MPGRAWAIQREVHLRFDAKPFLTSIPLSLRHHAARQVGNRRERSLVMKMRFNRRQFLKTSAVASAVVAPALAQSGGAQAPLDPNVPTGPLSPAKDRLPLGKIGSHEFSRLMLGGNLIGGYAHSRELTYVSPLMKRYNTDAKILETLELAETHGVNVMNSWVVDGNTHLQHHWKRGGKMKWIAQVRVPNGDLSQVRRAADLGAVAIHLTGDAADALISEGKIETIARVMQLIRELKCLAGVGAHGLNVIVESEKAKINPDFYVKTFHSHEYFTAPKPGDTNDVGRNDNSWCRDPEEVAETLFNVRQPWIAFKVLAAGAIPPQRGFRYAFENGADFILVGMFDWQVAEDVAITKQVLGDLQRLRPWRG